MRRVWILTATVFAISGCGRYFPTALQPAAGQAEGMTANDDGSITYELDRLAITLRPMTDAEINRQFASESSRGASSVNPFSVLVFTLSTTYSNSFLISSLSLLGL